MSIPCGNGHQSFHSGVGRPTRQLMDADPESAIANGKGRSGVLMISKGGWKTMPFILGNEICERMGSVGILPNLAVYLISNYHMTFVRAGYIVNSISGTCSLTPLAGAYLADAVLGRYRTVMASSCFTLMGLILLTISAMRSALRPAQCFPPSPEEYFRCQQATTRQVVFLLSAFGLIAIGSGGLRSCNYTFGADQFDGSTPEGKRSRRKFFSWFYFFGCFSVLFGLTIIVYIQTDISWGLGYLIVTIFMVISILLFLFGTPLYRQIPMNGSAYTSLWKVLVAAFLKRNCASPSHPSQLYEFQSDDRSQKTLTHTATLRFLDKAAIVSAGDLEEDGSKRQSSWRLCTVNQVEECKAVVNLLPIWACGIWFAALQGQLVLYTVSQAVFTNLFLGHFKVPPASLVVVLITSLVVAIAMYELPAAMRVTKNPRRLSLLKKIGMGTAIMALALVVAGLVEWKRLRENRRNKVMTVLWLIPQFVILGAAESLAVIGQVELYYEQLPVGMRSLMGAIYWSTNAIGSYLANVLVSVVDRVTGRGGRPWLADNIDDGRLDKFYYLLAGVSVVVLLLFMGFAHRYTYVQHIEPSEETSPPHGAPAL